MVAHSADSVYRPAGQGSARRAARCDGGGVGAERAAGIGVWSDSVDGLRGRDCRAAGGSGAAGAVGIRGVFLAAAIPGALCVLVALFGIREPKKSPRLANDASAEARRVAPWTTDSRSTPLPGAFYFVLVAVTLFSLGNSSDMFLVMRAQNVGIRVALAPLLGLVFNITYTLGSWPAGWFSDHFSRRGISRRWIAAAGYLIFAAVYFVFGRAPSTLAIWITMAVYGLYYALTQPVLKALVVETVGARRSRTRTGHLFLRDQRGDACRQPDYWRIVEAFRRRHPFLFLLRVGFACGNPAFDQAWGRGRGENPDSNLLEKPASKCGCPVLSVR